MLQEMSGGEGQFVSFERFRTMLHRLSFESDASLAESRRTVAAHCQSLLL